MIQLQLRINVDHIRLKNNCTLSDSFAIKGLYMLLGYPCAHLLSFTFDYTHLATSIHYWCQILSSAEGN